MLLVIDVGNTNIVGGLYDDHKLITSLRIHTVPKKTEDEYSTIFKSLLVDRGVSMTKIKQVVVSSVVPALSEAIRAMCEHLFSVHPIILGPSIYSLLPIGITNPHEIGTDLVADALAAYTKAQGAAIVVDFGTALTFTCVDVKGIVLGVSIAPGLGTAVSALIA